MAPVATPPAAGPARHHGHEEERLSARLVVLVSGAGTTLQALLDASGEPAYGARVVAVGADRDGIPALKRAEQAAVPTFVLRLGDHADRIAWDRTLAAALDTHAPDLVVLAGFMKLLGPAVLERFPDRVVNTHAALLPAFPGAHPVRDALAYGVRVTGATVHLVDTGVDTGPVVAQVPVEVREDDDEAALHERIQSVERGLLVDVVGRLVRGYRVEGRRVVFG